MVEYPTWKADNGNRVGKRREMLRKIRVNYSAAVIGPGTPTGFHVSFSSSSGTSPRTRQLASSTTPLSSKSLALSFHGHFCHHSNPVILRAHTAGNHKLLGSPTRLARIRGKTLIPTAHVAPGTRQCFRHGKQTQTGTCVLLYLATQFAKHPFHHSLH